MRARRHPPLPSDLASYRHFEVNVVQIRNLTLSKTPPRPWPKQDKHQPPLLKKHNISRTQKRCVYVFFFFIIRFLFCSQVSVCSQAFLGVLQAILKEYFLSLWEQPELFFYLVIHDHTMPFLSQYFYQKFLLSHSLDAPVFRRIVDSWIESPYRLSTPGLLCSSLKNTFFSLALASPFLHWKLCVPIYYSYFP